MILFGSDEREGDLASCAWRRKLSLDNGIDIPIAAVGRPWLDFHGLEF